MVLMYYLLEYSDNYLKTSGRFWQYYQDEPHDTDIVTSKLFIPKVRITEKTLLRTKDVEIAVLLKYLSNFWGLLKCL